MIKRIKKDATIHGASLRNKLNKEVIDVVNDLAESPYKVIADTTYEISDADNQKILFFTSNSEVTINLKTKVNSRVEVLCVKDGTGNLVFAGIDGATVNSVGTTLTDQYGGATVLKREGALWSVLGNLV
tara:strand:+ start:5476 stop:5862 length:387 start_codon:yes stop_codon:yes gene_type:complete